MIEPYYNRPYYDDVMKIIEVAIHDNATLTPYLQADKVFAGLFAAGYLRTLPTKEQ